MKKTDAKFMDFFDRHVCQHIIQKYGFTEKEAINKFLLSQTYQMLCDAETELYTMSPLVLFDMWESEMVTGDPRRSIYIRGEHV